MGGVIGSIAGVVVLAMAAVVYFRRRARLASNASRARTWVVTQGSGMSGLEKDMISKPVPRMSMV